MLTTPSSNSRELSTDMTPTQRTLKALRDAGLICGIVERFNRFGGPHGVRQDLFGIIDIIALNHGLRSSNSTKLFGGGVVGIQSCGTAFSEHFKKITVEKAQEARDWLLTPGTSLELWGWRKVRKSKTDRRMVYRPRVQKFTTNVLVL